MKKFSLIFLIIVSIMACNHDEDSLEIKKVMSLQEEAWNNGDIEQFMEGYWKSDSLMFIGKNGIKYGWQTTLDNYKVSYPDKTAMGKLNFEIIKLEVNSSSAYMLGKWKLLRKEDTPNGYFTLYWKKIEGKWVITIDHTS
ncbi:nuclear transport factor 2 family protein [Vicingus serpentipes]|uniref:Nuclear transport factor 2 family protein n=1 Tax=Vicingus serpentipes TaxID=1926625 RepID=A0A5C6RT78_9FLAO|nr:nuclear transport factor 2 family protein [Vicingus serpentipes]TXB65347.1 nuclear transport factor 2 family protein [Vicingus serpentipes]